MSLFQIKSIQTKLLIWIIPVITIILTVLAIAIYQQQKQKHLKDIDDFSMQIVNSRSHEIEKWLNSLVLELKQIAQRNIVQTMDWNVMQEEIKAIAETRKNTYGFFAVFQSDGYYYSTLKGKSDISLKDKEYFKAVFEQGKDFAISNPYNSATTGEPIFLINVPIKNDKGELVGSLAGIVYLSTLSKIAGDIKIGASGYGWIVDSDGLVFAHPDSSIVLNLNILKSTESGFQNLDIVGSKMLHSNAGTGIIQRPDNVEEYLIFSRIPVSPNWTLGVSLPSSQVFAGVKSLLLNLIVFFVATILIILFLLWLLTSVIIIKPIKALTHFTNAISQGNLFEEVNINTNDEVGIMALSLKKMSLKLKDIAEKIRDSSANIAGGSSELSNSASQIAEGAGEQAASTEEVSSSVEEMVAIINQNAENAEQTEKMALKAAEDIENVREAMFTTIKAINTIAAKISIISEISGKTDLLAVNAAIEAARAGETGKGFAVVATEVRKLAENSKKAAVEINQVSASTVELAEKSGKLLEDVVPIIKKNADLVREISAASTEQNSGAEQINKAVQQLAQVTQENSASAEQMATGSIELAHQAELLKDIVTFFKISREEENSNITNIAYRKLLEAISVLEKNNALVKDNKIVIDLSEVNVKTPIKKGEVRSGGIDINMGADQIDSDYENIH